MDTNTAERLEQAIATLNELIELAEGCGLRESAQFLAMAKLHLQIDLNEVTDSEFRTLCAVLEGEARKPRDGASARAPLGRNRRDGELRAMRRAWQCPQDAPAPRGGRRRAGQ
jgi:hypothetical protein